MKKLFKFISIFIIASAITAAYGYWQGNFFGFRFWTWHQKLAIEITTPAGIKTASSVTEVSWDMPPRWFKIGDSGGWHGGGDLKGEAVVLEMAPAKYLFVLLKGYSEATAIEVFANPPLISEHPTEYTRVLDRLPKIRETRVLPRELYPMFVTFDDISDPASVKRVDPANLAATFGPGHSLNKVTLSITDEPGTKGSFEKVFPSDFFSRWAKLYNNALAQGGIENPFIQSFAGSLDRSNFILE